MLLVPSVFIRGNLLHNSFYTLMDDARLEIKKIKLKLPFGN